MIPPPLPQLLPISNSSINSYLQTNLLVRSCVYRSDLGKTLTIPSRYLIQTQPTYKYSPLEHLRSFPWVIQQSKLWIRNGTWEIFQRKFSLISQSRHTSCKIYRLEPIAILRKLQASPAFSKEFCDVFTWYNEEMTGIDPSIVKHEIKIYDNTKLSAKDFNHSPPQNYSHQHWGGKIITCCLCLPCSFDRMCFQYGSWW